MRVLRATIAVVVFTLGGLLIASPVSAQVSQITLGKVTLGPEGGTVLVPVTYVCDVGSYSGASVYVQQSTGKTLASAYGSASSYSACTGAPQTVVVTAYAGQYGALAFKRGGAAVTAYVQSYDNATGSYSFSSLGPVEVRITSR